MFASSRRGFSPNGLRQLFELTNKGRHRIQLQANSPKRGLQGIYDLGSAAAGGIATLTRRTGQLYPVNGESQSAKSTYKGICSVSAQISVGGGGGAAPYEVDRTQSVLYRESGSRPNYHYIRLELRNGRLSGEMIRLSDYAAAEPHEWDIMDRFELNPPP